MNINTETIIITIVGAVIGGSGIVGLLFSYVRRFIDKRLDEKESESAKNMKQKKERLKIENELNNATYKLLLNLYRVITTLHDEHHDGDLEAAWNEFQEARAAKERYDRSILVNNIVNED